MYAPSTGTDQCLLPVEAPFLCSRRSSSAPIDSFKGSPSDEYASGMARTTSVEGLRDHTGSNREISTNATLKCQRLPLVSSGVLSAQPVTLASATQLAVHEAMTMRHLSLGSFETPSSKREMGHCNPVPVLKLLLSKFSAITG